MSKSLPLVETVVSWQGEGIFQGELSFFLRFKRCNRKVPCPFCDTMERISDSFEHNICFDDLFNVAHTINDKYVITGGEPTLYNNHLVDFFKYLDSKIKNGIVSKVTIETNGYKLKNLIAKLENGVSFVFLENIFYDYSPKEFDNPEEYKKILSIVEFLYEKYNENSYIKIVAYDHKEKYKYTKQILEDLTNRFPKLLIYVMPEGSTYTEIILHASEILSIVKHYKCNFSSRMHLIHNFY